MDHDDKVIYDKLKNKNTKVAKITATFIEFSGENGRAEATGKTLVEALESIGFSYEDAVYASRHLAQYFFVVPVERGKFIYELDYVNCKFHRWMDVKKSRVHAEKQHIPPAQAELPLTLLPTPKALPKRHEPLSEMDIAGIRAAAAQLRGDENVYAHPRQRIRVGQHVAAKFYDGREITGTVIAKLELVTMSGYIIERGGCNYVDFFDEGNVRELGGE